MTTRIKVPHLDARKTERATRAIERSWALGGPKDHQQPSHPAGEGLESSASTSPAQCDSLDAEQDADGDYWYSGADIRYPPPKHGDSWENCHQMLQRLDKTRCEAWKDEVDKLLIFAGLFSAVITGFSIQSFKLLNADPAAATAQLLAIIARELSNDTTTGTTQQAVSSILSGMQNFQAQPYAIRVNILWFLSLTFALASAIIGILCMQWLREYQRESGLPPMESFAVAQIRREGLERWSVPTVLNALPVLLQSALVLFFIGLIDFLRNSNSTVAAVISVFVVIIFLFLVATTALPSLQFLFHGTYHFRVPQCPFKSPQSWAFCRLTFNICKVLAHLMPEYFVVSMSNSIKWEHMFERGRLALRFAHWQNFDKFWYDKRMRYHFVDRSPEPNDDFVNGFIHLANTHLPRTPMFYDVLQCMRSSPIEANKLGNTLFRLLGSKHNRICDSLRRLSGVQAKDALSLLSLRYLPDPAMQSSAEVIKSHLELAIRINNTVEHEDVMIDFIPPAQLDDLKRVEIPDDIMYHAFKCIGRLAKADRDLRYGIDSMFMLLVSTLAQRSINRPDAAQLDHLLESMFNTCQRIERWSQQRRVDDLRAVFRCISWVGNAFSAPVVDGDVLLKWRKHSAFEKLSSLLRTLDEFSEEMDGDIYAGIPPMSGAVWASVRQRFFLDTVKDMRVAN